MDGLNIKTVLYVLFAIGWLFFQYLKNKSKKHDLSNPNPDSDDESKKRDDGDLKTIIENVLGTNTDKKEIQVFEKENVKPFLTENKTENKLFHEVTIDDMHRASDKKENIIDSSLLEEHNEPNEVVSGLDLKKIVIYHEIMKRPTY